MEHTTVVADLLCGAILLLMTTKLAEVMNKLSNLPIDRQNELAPVIASLAENVTQVHSEDQLRAIDEGLADAKAGQFVKAEEITELFSRFRAA